jgi:hypothetical protein
MKNDYGSFVMNYRRYTHTPRSFDEAYNTASHATPIWRCETVNEAWWRVNSWWIVTAIIIAAFVFVLYPTLEWIITQ